MYAYAILFDCEATATAAPANGVIYLHRFITACLLLDTLLWVYSWPTNLNNLPGPIPRTVSPPRSEKFNALLSDLGNWNTILKHISRLRFRQEEVAAVRRGASAQTVSNVESLSLGAKTFDIALDNYVQAMDHGRRQKDHKILEHIYSVAFVMRWFSLVMLLL